MYLWSVTVIFGCSELAEKFKVFRQCKPMLLSADYVEKEILHVLQLMILKTVLLFLVYCLDRAICFVDWKYTCFIFIMDKLCVLQSNSANEVTI